MGFGGEQIKVLLAVSNNILAEGLRRILLEDGSFKIFTINGSEQQYTPDLILFDSNQKTQELSSSYPQAKLILLDTGLKERDLSYLLLCHQISGIIAPDASVEMLHKSLRVVHNGEIWIDQEQLKSLLRSGGSINGSGGLKGLSNKDKEIVQLITKGYKNREIGVKLCLSEHTIKAHVSRIYRKLNVSNRTQLVSLVMESDLDNSDFQNFPSP